MGGGKGGGGGSGSNRRGSGGPRARAGAGAGGGGAAGCEWDSATPAGGGAQAPSKPWHQTFSDQEERWATFVDRPLVGAVEDIPWPSSALKGWHIVGVGDFAGRSEKRKALKKYLLRCVVNGLMCAHVLHVPARITPHYTALHRITPHYTRMYVTSIVRSV